MESITFIVPVGNEETYHKYFLSSPLFKRTSGFQILAQRGFKTAGAAFNEGIAIATNDVIVCAHQDVILPAMWARRFLSKLHGLESCAVRVGVVGCIGITSRGEPAGHVYHRDREYFPQCELPANVETLDELLISFRKSTMLRFDPTTPSFFAYAVDLCLQARSRGLANFAVDAPCVHHTVDRILPARMPAEYFLGLEYIIDKWRGVLPVHHLSGTLEGKWSFRLGRLKWWLLEMLRYSPPPWWRNLPQVDLNEVLAADTSQRETLAAKHESRI
jgi:GT2 family glycosyltransferase